MIRLDNLKRAPGATKNRKRVGRGTASGWGKTAGKGQDGQKARGGSKFGFEGGQMPLQRRIPKRGFNNPFKTRYNTVNLKILETRFEDGAEVTPEVLLERRIISQPLDGVKILAHGEITKKLKVRAHKFSKAAKEKIEACGGSAEVI
jgi:large subunit ribosomal protein L15